MSRQLHEFEGREVIGTQIKLVDVGDGLSQAVAVEDIEIRHGEKVYLVIEAEADKVRFDKSRDDKSKLIRVQILKGGTVAIVDFAFAAEVLAKQDAANDAAKAKAKLPFEKDVSNPADWETPERTPGGEPAKIGSLAEKALEKAAAKKAGAAKRAAKPKGDAPT